MKKLYTTPDILKISVESVDVLTQSLMFSEQENAEIHQNDIHPFGSFFQ